VSFDGRGSTPTKQYPRRRRSGYISRTALAIAPRASQRRNVEAHATLVDGDAGPSLRKQLLLGDHLTWTLCECAQNVHRPPR
jgi:hypothetical protein